MSTIKDVAKAAGVSVSTVSNIINNKNSVNIELYNRVMQVMKEMNYRPNILAMNLRKNNMNFVGVVFCELSVYSSKLFEGTLFQLEELGYQAIVKFVREDHFEIRDTINQFLSTGVKGIILCTPHVEERMLQSLNNTGTPILMLDYCLHIPGFLTMEFDNTSLVRDLTSWLLEQGKTVGLVTGSHLFACERTCWTGFLEGIGQSGGSGEQSPALELPFSKSLLYKQLLEELPRMEELPECLIVSNEYMADCLREALRLIGRDVCTCYVLSCQQTEDRGGSRTVRISRDAVRCAQKAAAILDEQIREPIVNDSLGEMEIPRINLNQIAKHSYDRKLPFPERPLRVLLPDVPMSRSIRLLSSDFKNRTGIETEFVLKNMTELQEEIIRSCRGEAKSYDVAAFHINWLSELGRRDYLRPLTECLDFEKICGEYLPKVQKVYFNRECAVYGIPAEMGVQILAYRDDIFSDPVIQKNYYSEVGLELQPPRSWTEFNIIARYFTRKYNPSSPVQYGTCIAGHIPTGLIEEFWPRSLAFRGKIFENETPKLNTAQNIKALENLCDSYRYSYPACQTFMDSEQVNTMLAGDIAMIVTYYSYMVFNSTSREKRIKFSRTPSNMTVIDSYLLGIPVNSEEPQTSGSFIEWCCSDDIAVKSVLLGRLIPKKSVMMNGEIECFHQGLKGMFDNIEATVSKDEIFTGQVNSPDFDEIMAGKLAEAVYGGEPAEKVMNELQQLLVRK